MKRGVESKPPRKKAKEGKNDGREVVIIIKINLFQIVIYRHLRDIFPNDISICFYMIMNWH